MHDEEACKVFRFSDVTLYDQDSILHKGGHDHSVEEDLLILKA